MLRRQNARAKISIMNGGEDSIFGGGANSGTQNPEHQRHSVIGSRRYHAPSDEQKYAAATDLANNPNTPEFFSEAVMANTAIPQPRKSHKKLIIIAAAIIIVAAIAITIVVVSQNRGREGNELGSADAIKSFNRLANYATYGTDSEEYLSEPFDEFKSYYAEQHIQDLDSTLPKKEYGKKLGEYASNFKSAFSAADKSKMPQEIQDEIADALNYAQFLSQYAATEDPDYNILGSMHGKSDTYTTTWSENYYIDFLSNKENSYAQTYGSLATENLKIKVDISKKYNIFILCNLTKDSSEAEKQLCSDAVNKITPEDMKRLEKTGQYDEEIQLLTKQYAHMMVYELHDITTQLRENEK